MTSVENAYEKFCTKRFPLPTEEEVADLEERIGVSFPEDYRRYLLAYNGGYFNEPEIVPVVKGCPSDLLTSMDGIAASHPSAELASRHHLSLFDDNDPPEVIPIGYTIMGHLILIITHYEGNGTIILKTFQECYFLADGIEEFFGLLREPEPLD